MKKRKIRLLTGLLLCLAMLASILSVPVSALEAAPISRTAPGKSELRLDGIRSRSISAYTAVPVLHNGNSLGNVGRLINGELYVPIRQYVESTTSARVTYNSSSKTLTVTGGGHNISVSDGGYVMYAGGRALFRMTPAILMNNGRMYVPLISLAKALSLNYSYENGVARTAGSPAPIPTAERYYAEDAVYWLSRIISAESRGESLLGQIAVGTVILNRVSSDGFPNTIWGVIFDRKYGVQFSPVANGTIYNTPPYTSVLAAKICLEGFLVSDEVLYFIAPSVVSNSWIQRTRTYEFSIGHHDFYS